MFCRASTAAGEDLATDKLLVGCHLKDAGPEPRSSVWQVDTHTHEHTHTHSFCMLLACWCRVTDEGGSSLQASNTGCTGSTKQDQCPAHAQAQDPGSGLDQQAATLCAEAIASAATEPADQAQHAPADGTAAAAPVAALPATPSAAGQSTTGLQLGASTNVPPTPAAGNQNSSASGLRTPVVLPPDAADLPVQAVLDELDTLLAKSDELRSSVQLRSSRQVSGQHTSTHLSRRNSLSALDKPLLSAAAAAAAEARAGSGTEWEDAARSSRRRSSSQPPAADRPRRSSSRSSVLHIRVNADADTGLTRTTMLDSTEARDEIKQHLCMVRLAAGAQHSSAAAAAGTSTCTCRKGCHLDLAFAALLLQTAAS